jgi:hypothetical protein
MLPSFLVIGAPRCATTWIYHSLREHPEVFVPEEKEVRFFDENYHKGVRWYEDQFTDCINEKAVGEVATKYLSRPCVPERVHQVIPNVKLIASLRDPVKRAYSAYGHDVRRGMHSVSFEEAIKQHYTEYIARGFYYDQLSRYLEYFPKHRMLVLIYDDLKKDPTSFVENIYRFLGVNCCFTPSQLNQRRNRGITHQDSRLLDLFISLSKRALRITWLKRILDSFKTTRPANTILERIVFADANADMNPETREQLRAIFQTQNERLSDLLGRDLLEEWQ